MSYALDINNQRVKTAMENLGVDKEELLIKPLNDFGHKSTREEIKQLRFTYYNRRLEETVSQIKDLIRSKTIKFKPDQTKSISITPEEEAEESIKDTEETAPEKKFFINEKYKETLITALEEIKEITQKDARKERPKSTAQPRSAKMSRIEQFKKTQQINIAKIRGEEEVKVKNALSQSFGAARPSRSTPRSKEFGIFLITDKKLGETQNPELEIAEKLMKYEEKLEKSRILHEKQVLIKRESARSQHSDSKICPSPASNDNLIFKIIERSKVISQRKHQKNQKLLEKWRKLKSFKEQRAKKLEELEKDFKKNISEKEATLSRKLNAAEKIIKNRKSSVGKEIELKIELQKLKDEDASIKVKRAQKMM
jgi:hypothetical protein